MIKRGIDRWNVTRALGWVAIVLAMALVAPGRAWAQPAPAAKTHVSLWLDWVPEPEFGGFYQAAQTGAYAAHGLDVEIKTAGPGAPTWQLVDTGKCDYATTAADQVLIARARGADVVALFAVYQTFPQGIMVHKARGFKSIADVFANSGTLAAEDDTWLRFLRAKYPNPKVNTISYSGGVAAFLAKPDYSQQCFVTSEPLQAARQGGDPQTFLIADAGYNPYTTVVITRGQTVRSNLGQVRSMIDACRQGWRAYLDDPNAANAAMGKLNTQMDSATFTAAAAAQKPLIETAETGRDRLGMMSSQRWRDLGAQLVQLKVIEKAAGPEECFVQP